MPKTDEKCRLGRETAKETSDALEDDTTSTRSKSRSTNTHEYSASTTRKTRTAWNREILVLAIIRLGCEGFSTGVARGNEKVANAPIMKNATDQAEEFLSNATKNANREIVD